MNKLNLKSKKIIPFIAIGLLVLIIAIVLITGARDDTEATYTTATAEIMTIENCITSDGEIQSCLEESISPHTGYYLESIEVEEGEALNEGDSILTYTNGKSMKAPYNCVITAFDLPDEDEQLTSKHTVSLAATDELQMELSVGEDDIADIALGQSATISVESTSDNIEGEVTYISSVGDYSGGTSSFTVKITFANSGKIKLGMSASASIILARAENALAVPVSAISTRDGINYVTLENGEQTEVKTGIKNDAYIEILSGLSEGDVIQVPVTEDSTSAFSMFGGGDTPGDMNQSGDSMPQGGGDMPQGGGTPPDNK